MKNFILLIAICSSFLFKAQINFDFENFSANTYSTLSGWTSYKGAILSNTANGLCGAMSTATSAPVFKIVSTPFTIPSTNDYIEFDMLTVPVSPFGGTKVLEMNSLTNVQNVVGSVRLEQTFTVTNSNRILQYAYCTAIRSVGHPCCQSQYNFIGLYDCAGSVIPAASTTLFPFAAGNISGCSNTGSLGMSLVVGQVSGQANTLDTQGWLIRTYDLSAYIGNCVKLRVESGTCSAAGHSSSFYFDAGTFSSPLQINNQLVTAGTQVLCDVPIATLSAIPAQSYQWNGPNNFTSTAASFTTTTSGIYTLSLFNPGNLNALTHTVNLIMSNTPTLQVSSTLANICSGQSSILNATGSGINSYNWSNGSTSQSVVVSPSTTTVYTITANVSTCPVSKTVALNVSACLSILEQFNQSTQLNLFPNPSNGSFIISSTAQQQVQICDLTGRIILRVELNGSNNYQEQMTDFLPGVYLVQSERGQSKIMIVEPR
jgi:hypothetical protein